MKRTALITGASSGIGYELALLFARDGHDVVLVARGAESLEKVAAECRGLGVAARTLVKDLSEGSAPDEIHDELASAGVSIDFLVNNAGYALFGPFVEAKLSSELKLVQLNITSLTHLTRLYMADMLARGFGRILNVASTAAFQAGPYMAIYYASKSYVLSLSEALASELRGAPVTVTCLCPGPTRTGFQQKAEVTDLRLVQGAMMMEAGPVAKAGYRAMMAGRAVVIPGWKNVLGQWGTKLAPRNMPIAAVRYLHQRKPM